MSKTPSSVRNSRAISQLSAPSCLPKVVSLFCGAGGLDLGFKKAGFEVAIAFDRSEAAVRSHKKNFPGATAITADLQELGPSGVCERVSKAISPGSHIAIIGGPPCQGFSRANVGADPKDPRNKLPDLYVNIVRELQSSFEVSFVVFENVLGMRDSKHARTYKRLLKGLTECDFVVRENEMCALDYGVPQARRRIILSALSANFGEVQITPRKRSGPVKIREVLEDLPPPTFYSRDLDATKIPFHPNHWTMNPRSSRFATGDSRSDGRSFKRLDWDKPSPTIAFGHREIHVHPNGSRRLSVFEAMLLQGFTKDFVLEGNLSEQVEQISNAVPPPLAHSVASAIRRSISKQMPNAG